MMTQSPQRRSSPPRHNAHILNNRPSSPAIIQRRLTSIASPKSTAPAHDALRPNRADASVFTRPEPAKILIFAIVAAVASFTGAHVVREIGCVGTLATVLAGIGLAWWRYDFAVFATVVRYKGIF